jgi:hypothetical protein
VEEKIRNENIAKMKLADNWVKIDGGEDLVNW